MMRAAKTALVVQPPLLLSRHFIDMPTFASYGAYQAAAVLLRRGFDVEVIDGFDRSSAGLVERGANLWLGEPYEDFVSRLKGRTADLVLVGSNPFLTGLPGRATLRDLVKVLDGRLVLADMFVGGMHYLEYDAEELLRELPGLNLILRYEGERLLERLADSVASGERPEGVWENHEAFPLDDLPAPAFGRMDREAYFGFLARVLAATLRPGPFPAQPERTLPLLTARGCPFGCIFCTRNPGLPGERRQYRTVPLDVVENWIKSWVRDFRIQRLAVLDEVANLEPKRFGALLSLLEENNLRVEFPNGLRADRLCEDDIRRLRSLTSGLKVSLESGSRRVQRQVLHKDLEPESVERVAIWCKRHGLGLAVHCLIGIPGETRAEIGETLGFMVRLHDEVGVRPLLQFATALPGTELRRIVGEPVGGAGIRDIQACFQNRSLIRTPEFDPVFLGHAAEALRRRTGDLPRKVIVNLTYRCNNRCVFCAVGDRPSRDADLDEVLLRLREHREEGFELMDIDGGEPTLHPDLFRLIAKARELGYGRISLTTNGRRASYRSYAQALAKDVDEVLVSLHAPDAGLQDRLTGSPESFAQTLDGIRNLRDARPSVPEYLGVNTTVLDANLSALREVGALLAEEGIRRWNLQLVTPFGRAQAGHLPDDGILRETLLDLLRCPPGGLRLQVVNCPPCTLPGFEDVALADCGKAQRQMVFVGGQGENLQAFLARKRSQDERCEGCPWAVCCPGFYRFDP